MKDKPSGRGLTGALAVAAGIMASRLFGLVRARVFAHYLGTSPAAGAFRAAFRIPNALQNLFGEGALSASFIPVYAKLLGEGKEAEAAKVAGTILSLLGAVVLFLTTTGILAADLLADLLAPGLDEPMRRLTADLMRIMFPGVGLLVLSAWCLGILNSHRRYFISYAAPVLWNLAIIASLTVFGGAAFAAGDDAGLSGIAAYGLLAGSALQLLVQLPFAVRLVKGPLVAWAPGDPEVRRILGTFGPALLSRGVVQISGWCDQILASFLGGPVMAAIDYAQTLYLLPFSLIGTSMATSELTEMARGSGTGQLKARLHASMGRLAFFMAPSVMAFLVLGDIIVAMLFQTGRFGSSDVPLVHAILAAMGLGLSASARTRLTSSAFWSLHDTRTPLMCALLRIGLAAALGLAVVLPLRQALGLSSIQAAAGLALASALGAWVENRLSTVKMRRRIGDFTLGWGEAAKPWGAAIAAAAIGGALAHLTVSLKPIPRGLVVLSVYGAVYLGLTTAFRLPAAAAITGKLKRLVGRK